MGTETVSCMFEKEVYFLLSLDRVLDTLADPCSIFYDLCSVICFCLLSLTWDERNVQFSTIVFFLLFF
jgi:hypothetical protein